ncbi:MAG: hypothetical protein ACK4ZN_09140 [Oceanibaculum sp.]
MWNLIKKAARKTSAYNIKINTRTLISITNSADEKIQKQETLSSRELKEVRKSQESLMKDIILFLSNNGSMEEVENIINAESKKYKTTRGAEIAIKHVIESTKSLKK